MINIVVVSHGDLGEALIRSAEMIVGPAKNASAISLQPDDSPASFKERFEQRLESLEGEETLILIDLFGGTPYNVVAREALKEHVECITGVNLPMMLELLVCAETATAAELAESITQAGKDSVRNLGPLLKEGAQC